jgi:hypothetical protein
MLVEVFACMRRIARWMRWAGLATVLTSGAVAVAQAVPTAAQTMQLSAFGGLSGVFTDVLGGHNLSFTAGGDLSFRPFFRFGIVPSVEVRGTIPFVSGTIAGERSLMGGAKFERRFGPVRPYADILFGRGAIDYQRGGLLEPPYLYVRTTSNVYSPGGGVDLDLIHHWAAKVDFQYQVWSTYPPLPGTLTPIVLTGGVVYKFDFNHHYRIPKQPPVGTGVPPQPAAAR